MNFGMKRGIVISNSDPECRGRCKIFVPGVYPQKFADQPDSLPWAEPAMSLFGGGWSSASSANRETGVCTVPHAGTNGDGAQVWVFFDNDDIRYPVYFAVAQSGDGWFSRHSNQHVIATDNVRIAVDEYDGYRKIANKTKTASEGLVSEVSTMQEKDFNSILSSCGGAYSMKALYDSAGGVGSVFSMMESCGGYAGFQNVSDTCVGGVASLGRFIEKSGGVDSLTDFISSSGGVPSLSSPSSSVRDKIVERYGSVADFENEVYQVGGVEGLSSIVESFGGLEGFSSSMSSVNGSSGLVSLGRLESMMGGSEGMRRWNDGLRDGASSLNVLFSGKTAEDRLAEIQAGADERQKEDVTSTDTRTFEAGDSDPFISMVSRKGVKSRVKVEVTAPEGDVGVDLTVKGDVNMRVEGNVYREVTGNVYETYLGDHHVCHMKGYSEFSRGDRYVEIDGKSHETIGGSDVHILKGGFRQVVLKDVDVDVSDANYNLKASSFIVEANNSVDVQSHTLSINAKGGFDIVGHDDSTIRVDGTLGTMVSQADVQSGGGISMSGMSLNFKGSSSVSLSSSNCISIFSSQDEETIGIPCISISAGTLSLSSCVDAFLNFSGIFVKRIINSVRVMQPSSSPAGEVMETVNGVTSRTVNGSFTDTVNGARTNVTNGAFLNTVAGLFGMNVAGMMNVTSGTGVAIESTVGLSITGSLGTVVIGGQSATCDAGIPFVVNNI